MLIELTVRNLAIFEDVRVPFAAGLNVVTGETGAGKSILVEAIRLALGEKADPVAVRTGEPEAEVTALFDLSRRERIPRRVGRGGAAVGGGGRAAAYPARRRPEPRVS